MGGKAEELRTTLQAPVRDFFFKLPIAIIVKPSSQLSITMESESGTYTNSLTNSAPVTNVAQRNIEVREQHISNVTKVQKQYNSYYEPEKVHRKRRFTMVPLSRIVNPYIGHKQHLERIGHALKTHSRVALWGRGGIG